MNGGGGEVGDQQERSVYRRCNKVADEVASSRRSDKLSCDQTKSSISPVDRRHPSKIINSLNKFVNLDNKLPTFDPKKTTNDSTNSIEEM